MVNYSGRIKNYASDIMKEIESGALGLGMVLGFGIVATVAGLNRALRNYRRDAK